jgi:hypothetical protein
MTATLVIPWLLIPLFQPESATYLLALIGTTLSTSAAFIIEAGLRRQKNDAIHEHGARIRIDGRSTVLWFDGETLVTEIHEILRDYGAACDGQWLFELRAGNSIATLSADEPRSAQRIRDALTIATGQEPARSLKV